LHFGFERDGLTLFYFFSLGLEPTETTFKEGYFMASSLTEKTYAWGEAS